MTQSQDRNRDPRTIHAAEQVWATVEKRLDQIIAMVRDNESRMYAHVGNADGSVVFDYMKQYIKKSEAEGGPLSHQMTIVMCAAAITRLVRAPRTNDPLAQLDWKVEEEHDDH